MYLTVFGATGTVGSAVLDEALARGHRVTAAVRNPARTAELPAGAEPAVADAADAAQVATLARDRDAVIGATRPPDGHESRLGRMASALLTGTSAGGSRLLLVGGAATLTVPDTGRRLIDDPRYLPAAARAIAAACVDQLARCREHDGDWTYLSPPAQLDDGPRTGRYRVGRDELVVDEAGESRISVADLAVALVDELERPAHRRCRFTVGY
ncbi:3-beta hydroxysteroid dehydrogenase [Actinocatenispora thailandica]|uniref:3-beta hydroxysteroid dehydrogenase n=1 Tax=Actinocatenispora thailandica TaxID=227318 RepID=A0A7R7DR67_9ACTN|nr:NAD(P)H-binding protein [Actinocatenispora thailandica]BCJ36267.1 3-beta hydroxysteroid dehydrogenase [Actinocatenispora thailandica]